MPWGGIWKEYGMKYAHSAMGGNTDQFPSIQKQPHKVPDQTPLDGAAKTALAIKALDGADKDAEACLKQEFKLWLEGIHPVHNAAQTDRTPHNSDPHKRRAMQKRHIFPKTQDLMLQPHDEWVDTPWGNASLSSLPGVRQYLTAGKWAETEQDAQMNLLAEYGPNNIDEAWTYFKYWVKGAPMATAAVSGSSFMDGNPYYEVMLDGNALLPEDLSAIIAKYSNSVTGGVQSTGAPGLWGTKLGAHLRDWMITHKRPILF